MITLRPRISRFVTIQLRHELTGLMQNHSSMLQDLPPHFGAGQTAF